MQTVHGRIEGFDGVRAIAFLMVFVSHKLPTPATDRYGSAGVFIFFVLSGFLITRILMAARAATELGGVINGANFGGSGCAAAPGSFRCISRFSPS